MKWLVIMTLMAPMALFPFVDTTSESVCIGFRATDGCIPHGRRKPLEDRSCESNVPSHISGYCECDGGRKIRLVGCGHGNFTCLKECILSSQDSCFVDSDTGLVSCQTETTSMTAIQEQLRTLQKQQKKMQQEIKGLKYTNAQLMATLHITKARHKIDLVTECSAVVEKVVNSIVPVFESLNLSDPKINKTLRHLKSVQEELHGHVQHQSTKAQAGLMQLLSETTIFGLEEEAITRLILDAGISIYNAGTTSTKLGSRWNNHWRFIDVNGKTHWVPRSHIGPTIPTQQLIGTSIHVLRLLKSNIENSQNGKTSFPLVVQNSVREALETVEWIQDHFGLVENDQSTQNETFASNVLARVAVPSQFIEGDQHNCFRFDSALFLDYDYVLDSMSLLSRATLEEKEKERLRLAFEGRTRSTLSEKNWLRPRPLAGDSKIFEKRWVYDHSEWSIQESQCQRSNLGPYDGRDPGYEADLNFSRQEAVRTAFFHAWNSYKKYAYGNDELRPLTKSSSETLCNMSLTMIDSLDTLFLMGYFEDFDNASEYLSDYFSLESDININLFETTIRVLGGLLSAYDLSSDSRLLDLAILLADKMISTGAFDSPSGLPFGTLNLKNLTSFNPNWISEQSSLSEVATIQLEFFHLSRLTGNQTYQNLTERIVSLLYDKKSPLGLWPIYISPHTAKFDKNAPITLGARGDSAYEYLLKLALYLRKQQNSNVCETCIPHALHEDMFRMQQNTVIKSELDLVAGEQPTFYSSVELQKFLEGVSSDGSSGKLYQLFASIRHQYHISLHGILTKLLFCSASDRLAFLAELVTFKSKNDSSPGDHSYESLYKLQPKMDHLVCFTPGMLALGIKEGFGVNNSLFALWSHVIWQNKEEAGSMSLDELSAHLPYSRREQLNELKTDAQRVFNDSSQESFFLNVRSIEDAQDRIMDTASMLMRSCYELYNRTKTGLAPEIASFKPDKIHTRPCLSLNSTIRCNYETDQSCVFNTSTNTENRGLEDVVVHQDAKHSLLRPETVESLFILWRVTGDPIYREWGWNIFQSIQMHAFVGDAGYASVSDTSHVLPAANSVLQRLREWQERRTKSVGQLNKCCCPARNASSMYYAQTRSFSLLKDRTEFGTQNAENLLDKMESFLMAETFKYLYLLFSDHEGLPLDDWVMNTEGHPLKMTHSG